MIKEIIELCIIVISDVVLIIIVGLGRSSIGNDAKNQSNVLAALSELGDSTGGVNALLQLA